MHDILVEHLEEFEFLWGQRRNALRSSHYTMRELSLLEDRIGAHVQGLLVAGPELLPLVEPGLDADESLPVFLAAYLLLRLETESVVQRVLAAFMTAKEGKLDGLSQALCHAALSAPGPLQKAVTSASAPVAVAAAEILAFHGRLETRAAQLDAFLKHEDPLVRKTAWRTLARAAIPSRADVYRAGLSDPDPMVQREALWAAAWQGYSGVLDHCRQLTRKPTPEQWEAIYLLAILGKPADVSLIRTIAQTAELGPRRFEAAAAYGHPELVDLLLAGLESADIRTALAAAKAFTDITGLDTDSDELVRVPPADGHELDEFEKEFLDEAKLPNRQRAREYWQKEQGRYSRGMRWARGLNLNENLPAPQLYSLDLGTRWRACLRGKFEGTWKGSMSDLEVFPQKSPSLWANLSPANTG
jgi:uncharacterized protein (TIGR02270 family)